MRIKGNAPRLFCIEGVNLVPGSQIVTGEDEARLTASAYFADQVKAGNFEVLDSTEADDPEDVVSKMSAAEMVEVVRETLTDAELDKLEAGETRKRVLTAIKAQRETLREGRGDKKDDEEGTGE